MPASRAMSASGGYGSTRVAAGIVGYADLTLGDRVEPVLEAHTRAGVRHAAGWDASDAIGNSRPDMRRLAAFDYGTVAAPPSSEDLAGYWRPYMETCIELFGANRCTFQSNFPLEGVGTGYASL